MDEDCYRVSQESVNEAFRELQNEFGSSRRREAKGAGKFDWISLFEDALEDSNDPFRSTVVDKKTAKKWIEKAFDFAVEFNEDFAAAQGEKDTTDEFLRKSRDWVARLYEENEEEEETKAYTDGNVSPSKSPTVSNSAEKQSTTQVTEPAPPPDKTNQIVSEETPDSEDRSDRDIFCVSIDLPGVDKTNIDITIDGDSMLIRAKRNASSDGLPIRMYTTKLAFPENADMEKLEANLKNGVLIVSAPKEKPAEGKRKIQVN